MQVNADERAEGGTEEVSAIKRHRNGESLSRRGDLYHRNNEESAPSILNAVREDGDTHGDSTMKARKNN